jgi:hypothetical protein
MYRTRHFGRFILGVWLIVTGLLLMVNMPVPTVTRNEE